MGHPAVRNKMPKMRSLSGVEKVNFELAKGETPNGQMSRTSNDPDILTL